MADELTTSVIDVPLTVMDQTPPDHGGPLGRIQSLKDCEVIHYVPPQAGGAGGATPQVVQVQPREAFVSLSSTVHDVSGNNAPTGSFPPAELLEVLGEQLVDIAESIPKVWNGIDWSEYSTSRVLTGQLSQSILHTSNKTIQASDSAVIGDVTCFVWTETNAGLTTSYVGFRAVDGAWIVQPQVLVAMTVATDIALAKVVSDGTRFWVFYNRANAFGMTNNIVVFTYDTSGALTASSAVTRTWTTSPGFWDITYDATTNAVMLAQPGSFVPSSDVHVHFARFEFSGPSTIIKNEHTDTSIHCQGPLAWLTAQPTSLANQGFVYLATIAVAGEGLSALYANEVDALSMGLSLQYTVIASFETHVTVDSMTGYLIESGGPGVIGVVVAVSFLSEYSPANGPPNDPALRTTQVYSCTRAGVSALIKQANGVCLQSRAFQIPTSPASQPDFVAVTYYQSGGGTLPAETAQTVVHTVGDHITGESEQAVTVIPGDFTTGAPHVIGSNGALMVLTQAIASITHNAGDGVVASTSTWTFLNATFGAGAFAGGQPVGSYLNISGSSISTNNQSYLIIGRTSATVIVTESVGSLGHAIQNDTLAGVTASLTANVTFLIPTASVPGATPPALNGDAVPGNMISAFIGGSVTVAGASNSGNNHTFTVAKFFQQFPPPSNTFSPFYALNTFIVCTSSGSPVTESLPSGATLTLSPVFQNAWAFTSYAATGFAASIVGGNLIVDGAEDGNNGSFEITSVVGDAIGTASQPTQLPQAFFSPLPTVSIQIPDPSTALTVELASVTFDDSYIGAFLTIASASNPPNDGQYTIVNVVGPHEVQVQSANGATGQIDEFFPPGVVITILRITNSSPAFQPCWFLTPLSMPQQIAGRFEYGIAYADWRFDGNASADGDDPGTDFKRNSYPLALASVPLLSDGVSQAIVLPYRALSFTAGQVVRSDANTIGVLPIAESTVGLKQFTLAGATFGRPVANSGELFIPGPMAASFTSSGFHEDGVALAFEAPFFVSQETDATVTIGLAKGGKYQVVVVAEVMDENGDRTFSIPSPPLNFTMQGDNNVATYGGRLVMPTNRTLISIAIYRTAIQGGVPTAIHYKVTNDLDVNGAGFTFSSINGGLAPDTWTFRDTVADVSIVTQEQLYTDKGYTPRFPAPAFSQGAGSWCNRTWLVGYDGAIWMSGEKTEGDAIWFTPLFRYVLPTDDKPVAVAGLDEYLLVFCTRSKWYIPKADFPSATLATGSLPTPVQLPSSNGCTGAVLTIKSGVVYAATSGGAWLMRRDLSDVWLSQPVQDDLGTLPISTFSVDQQQRLFVVVGTSNLFVFNQVSGSWSIWRLPNTAALGAVLEGNFAYHDTAGAGHVAVHTPGVYADNIGGSLTPIAPDIQFAGLSFAGVRSYKRCWSIQIVGLYKGPHRLNVVVTYPDDDIDPTTYDPFTPDPSAAYVYEVNPGEEEASTFSVRLFADFVGIDTPGNSFVLELLSFEVGLERGIGRLPPAKRIPSG